MKAARSDKGRPVDPLATLASALGPERPDVVRFAASASLAKHAARLDGKLEDAGAVRALGAASEGSNVELRGYANIVRNNQISDSAGYSIKIQTDGEEYDGGGNVVENNQLSGAAAETFKIKSDASQGRFCGNSIVASGEQQRGVGGES